MNSKSASHCASMLVLSMVLGGCQSQSKPDFAEDKIRDYANALYNRQLYNQSIKEYLYYLENYNLNPAEAANVNYTVGDIYFERIHDYENALTYYLRIKHLYPESTLIEGVNKKMVACLERLQRSADAQQVLDEAVMLDRSQVIRSRPGTVIAKIGRRSITTGDLDHEIAQLPPYVRSRINNRSEKVDFLRQYIATELLFDTAKRKGLDKDREVIEATFQAKKNFMVQKLLEEEIAKEVNVGESDIELFYKANQDKYSEKDEDGNIARVIPLEEVKDRVMQDLIRDKQKEAYDRLIQRMMRAEAVDIYEDKL